MNAATPTISTDVAAASRVVDAPADVVELARTAARQDAGAPGLVGSFVDAVSEDDVALTLRFATTEVAYTGWTWCVTVALVDPAQPTISEVVLLPGPDSLLPPPWLPWNERVRPGDLGPGDLLLAPAEDDPRLVPAYVESDDPAVEDVAHELGIGRVRVMSRAGRLDTAERWHDSAFGPTADMAKQAPLHCVMCAFFLPLAGSLGARFGACGNEMSPADGRIVDLGYGCGAHSENVIEPVPTGFRPSHIDDTVLDVHPRTAAGGGLVDGAAAFLGEDDSELEVAPIHGSAVTPGVPAETAAPAVDQPVLDGAPAVAGTPAEDGVSGFVDETPSVDGVSGTDEAPAVGAEASVDDGQPSDRQPPGELAPVDGTAPGEDVPAPGEDVPAQPSVEQPADEVPSDDLTAVGALSDGVPSEEVASDEVADDEALGAGPPIDKVSAADVPVDETAVDAAAAGGTPDDEAAVDKAVADEVAADEAVADEVAVDGAVADEVAADQAAIDGGPGAVEPDGEPAPGDADV